MARGRGRARRTMETGGPLSGMCWRCEQPIANYSNATKHHGHWIHKACAPGGDDE